MSRYSGLEALVGIETVKKVRDSRLLVVGAGGIGCEVLKDLVLTGFGEIHVVDLDTIDLSNLNRQFLFKREHVKQSKAVIAADAVSKFNPDVKVVPYIENVITSEVFSLEFFKSFTLVFNALDNTEARRHVNKMCVRANIPLLDCGSAGFFGQVQVILPEKSECYDCRIHPTPKSHPVCTIRSTPSQPVHCVVWAKSFFFAELFGEKEDEEGENLDEISENGEDEEKAEENQRMRQESSELADLRESLGSPEFAQKLVHKVFIQDIERLLLAPNAFSRIGRKPPVPISVNVDTCPPIDPSTLDEHSTWSVEEALGVLQYSANQLTSRIKENNLKSLVFDKDDDDAMAFVSSAAMIRAHIFHIPSSTRFALKQIAGNIIAAVATTNAVVAGFGTIEAVKLLAQLPPRDVDIFRGPKSGVLGNAVNPPDSACVVCGVARTTVQAPESASLGSFISEILQSKLGYDDVSLITDKLIYDPDFDDQTSKSLTELGLINSFMTVVDDDEKKVDLEVYIQPASEFSVANTTVPLRKRAKRAHSNSEYELEPKRIRENDIVESKTDDVALGDEDLVILD